MGEAAIAAGRRDAGIELLARERRASPSAVDAIYDQALGLDALAEATRRRRATARRAAELFERLDVVSRAEHGPLRPVAT